MKTFLLTLLLYFFTLPACAENTILIVGDSISAGYGIDPNQSWVALLQQRLNEHHYPYKVINASISGDTTSDGLARLPDALHQYHPTITLIELGGNDGLRGLQISQIKNNLIRMITLSRAAGSRVIVLGVRLPPNYGMQYTDQFHQIYTDLAKQHDITVIPFFMKGVDDNPALMQADGIHPKTDAQAKLLDNLWPVLQQKLNNHK